MVERIRAFVFEGEYAIREVQREGIPWFFLPDICKAMGLRNTGQVKTRLQPADWDTIRLARGMPGNEHRRGNPTRIIVTEGGMYGAILGSEKGTIPHKRRKLTEAEQAAHARAERFRRWVTHEVLPEIAATGSYQPAQNTLPLLDGHSEQPRIEAHPQAAPPQLPPPQASLQSQARGFDDWSLEESRVKAQLVTLALKTHGPYAARAMWLRLGFPPMGHTLPEDLFQRGRASDGVHIWVEPPHRQH